MITAVFISFLILGAPTQSAQDTVSTQRVRELESQLEALRTEIDEQRDYMSWTIFGERTAYAAFLTLIVALFGAVGYGVFRWRISQVKEEIKEVAIVEIEGIDKKTSNLRRFLEEMSERLDDFEERIINLEMTDIERTFKKSVDETNYSIAVMAALSYVEKIVDRKSEDTWEVIKYPSRLKKAKDAISEINERKGGIPKEFYISVVNKADKIIDKSDDEEINRHLYALKDELFKFEVLVPEASE